MAAAETKSGFATFAVVTSAVAALVMVLVLALFLQGGYRAARAREYQAKVLAPVDYELLIYREGQQSRLAEGYRWLDREQGVVGVPIERAIELVVERGGR
ncbi:MAG: hypothetical protein ABR506_04805 [Candidatus Krumholzibacteriia bacterium]